MRYEGLRRVLEQNIGLAFVLVIALFVVVLADPLYQLTLWLARILIGS
jgi:hypothetical protein